MASRRSDFGDGASPGKIFIGGLAKDTTLDTFINYFGKYGEITDSVIMKDRNTGRPRGFGFITYADTDVVDTVIAENHVINGKQVEIKRTIPKGDSKDFKTKKVFVGGIPTSVSEDDFKSFFTKFGKVMEHEIIRDHMTKKSRGFGFIVFDNEQVVDGILANGNMIDMDGTQVEIKKAEPKKPSKTHLVPPPAYGSEIRGRSYGESYGRFNSPYSGFGSPSLGPSAYRSMGSGLGGRFGDYNGYGSVSEFGGRYSDYRSSEFGGRYRDGPFGGYASRFGSYGRDFGEVHIAGGVGGVGTNGRGGNNGSYAAPGAGPGYESGPGAGYGGPGAVSLYGGRAGYSSSSRYHPYAR